MEHSSKVSPLDGWRHGIFLLKIHDHTWPLSSRSRVCKPPAPIHLHHQISPARLLIFPRPRSCYSAYEHSSLHALAPQSSSLASTASSQPNTATSLPLDISLETIISVVFICVGLVAGAEELKPITWRVWAGKVERDSGGGGPFQGLEERLGFVDIRVRFADFHMIKKDSEAH